jgi:hypothetical protein
MALSEAELNREVFAAVASEYQADRTIQLAETAALKATLAKVATAPDILDIGVGADHRISLKIGRCLCRN